MHFQLVKIAGIQRKNIHVATKNIITSRRTERLQFLSHAENKTEVLVVLPQFDSNAAKLRKSKVITDMASISALLF